MVNFSEVFATASFKRKAWETWYEGSHVLTIMKARDCAEALDVSARKALKELRTRIRKATVSDVQKSVQKHFQHHVTMMLRAADAYDHEALLGTKLQRWRITEVPEGTLARRACRLVREAFALVPARVANVLFRAWPDSERTLSLSLCAGKSAWVS